MGNPKYCSRKRCEYSRDKVDTFFSLADYRNNLFVSKNLTDLVEFYDSFANQGELIEWMKERPKGSAYIREISGSKDVVVVIPTADINGKYAIDCKEEIFKGLHIIFVESGEIPDPYFNYAHNVNIGIKRALEYNPKWVIYSNDDVISEDSSTALANELRAINHLKVDCVFANTSHYIKRKWFHSTSHSDLIGKPSRIYWMLLELLGGDYKTHGRIRKKFCEENYTNIMDKSYITRLMFKMARRQHITNFFAILSSVYLNKKNRVLFDETYINAGEDVDLSIELNDSARTSKINYRIGDLQGKSLGNFWDRRFRTSAGMAYFNYKLKNKLIFLK